MNIALSPELEKLLAEKVERGEIQSADKLVELALTFYFDYEAGVTDEQEFRETQTAIGEAREQSRRREALAATRVFEELRAKHGIPR
jgi:Arc/MetJ-type ribon-helix-helix transcriptional regulator